MTKYVYINMDSGDIFSLDSCLVAKDRAIYYATKEYNQDNMINYDEIYNTEYDYAMEHTDELIDWLRGNMDWEDISDEVQHVTHEDSPDYGDLFSSATFYVIDE